MKKYIRVYDGAFMCHTSNCCPVVEYDPKSKEVIVFDPAKPKNGKFVTTVEEWNDLLTNAKKIKV
jgi:hypothetical protein